MYMYIYTTPPKTQITLRGRPAPLHATTPPPPTTRADLLFSPHGTIRRIKIYRDQHGKPKGDALVTYAKPGSVNAAANKVGVGGRFWEMMDDDLID